MKKVFILCLIVLCISITGCGKEKDTFEHYDLKDKKLNTYIYYDDNRGREEYVLADMTTGDMITTTGFFYKIADNDYILIEKLHSLHLDAYDSKSTYQFYDNKLYGVGTVGTPMYFEIELKGKNSKIEEKNFVWEQQEIGPTTIENIDSNYITLYAYVGLENEAVAGRIFRCSLKDYKCEMQDNN